MQLPFCGVIWTFDHFNGNSFTKSMHLAVEQELEKMQESGLLRILNLFREKSVLLEKNGSLRQGRFDFLVQTPAKFIGFEVLTRPTRGKLKEKLAYAMQADEFVFVLPKETMNGYKIHTKGPYSVRLKKRFLGKDFQQYKLDIWVYDEEKHTITEKLPFSKMFNIVP